MAQMEKSTDGMAEWVLQSAVDALVRIARNVARERTWRACGSGRISLDVMDYVVQIVYLGSRCFGSFSIERMVARLRFMARDRWPGMECGLCELRHAKKYQRMICDVNCM